MMNEIPVFMSASEVERFKLFMRHYNVFQELLEAKVFEVKNGSATMDFNQEGDLMDIKINVVAYKRKK